MARSKNKAVITLGFLTAFIAVLLITPGMAQEPKSPTNAALGPAPKCSYTPDCIGLLAGHMLAKTLLDDPGCCKELIDNKKDCWDYMVQMFQHDQQGDLTGWRENVWSKCLTVAKPSISPSA